ncbi:MAG: hypothetical protein LBQ90_05030 [Synergistaceae bacterium]|jgi:V/A-type H+-transporting ATPase subunit E|nr:hypothetical protein [Synergistaceae bacterium]
MMKKEKIEPGSVVYDEKKKLAELQSMILHRGDLERGRILREAGAESGRWFEAHSAQLDTMVRGIKADAEKRAREMTARQMAEAESARDRDRLHLQNELVLKALARFQSALAALSGRPDYGTILTGMAIEACSGVPRGEKVKMRLCAEDASHGPAVAAAVNASFSDIEVVFDPTPAAISGGVFLYSEEGRWRIAADWKSKVEEMADDVARAVLAEL